MSFRLAPIAEARGFRLEAHETVGSTNALALDHARAGDLGNLWVVSKRQESGRGRRGREWSTPHGNLAATLLVVTSLDLKFAATLGFVAGLAVADALEAVAPKAGARRFELKWPNDVLAGGAKLVGIGLESTILDSKRFAVAVGIGVNVVAYPPDLPYPATSLDALGANCDAETLFLALSDAWSVNENLWDEGRGLSTIRKRWLDRAVGLGGPVAIRIDGNVVRGTFETIDEDCRFVIRDAQGAMLRIAAGDVHFGTVASAGV